MIKKIGSPEKIGIKIIGNKEFENQYKDIINENNLIRCPKCNRLISKTSSKGKKTLQHKGMKAVIDGNLSVKCTLCGNICQF